jgi:ketosteroid isomerase-like protein
MTGSSEIYKAITTVNDNFMAAFKQGDAARLAALYTENAQVLPPNTDLIAGQPAIQGFWQAVMDMGIKEITLNTGEVEKHGDAATEVSRFKLLGQDGQVLDKGKYIVIWKRDHGQWKLHRYISNSSLPVTT